MTRAHVTETIDAEARARLGIRHLHDEQRAAIRAATRGRDTLVVMPTGSGKSAVYQLTAEMRDGPTVVVSPLLALQHDQVRSIADSGLSRAAVANSLQSHTTFERVLDDFAAGRTEFLFVAPEQLARPDVRARLARASPSLFVVDEAHCVSMWGHDFRPDYLALGDRVRELGRPPVLALTASAAPPVRDEIVARLGLRDAAVVVGSFDRPELDLTVRRFGDEAAKRAALLDDAVAWPGPAIVYVATRRATTEIRDALRDQGVLAAAYHGGLARKERESVHGAFLEGSVPVVVATNAFGMGIDKPDVRVVAHFDVPGSLDAYQQEIGRAGRDGKSAAAVLFFRPEDLGMQRFFKGASVSERDLRAVLGATTRELRRADDIAADAGLSRRRTAVALDRLATGRAVRAVRGRWSTEGPTDDTVDAAVAAALHADETLRRVERSRLEMMSAYAETSGCRRVLLLGYYGEPYWPPCGRCDNCRDRDTSVPQSSPFAVGAAVQHVEWGPGTVMTTTGDRVVVLFRDVGYRTLLTDLVLEHDLLEVVVDS